jgi:ribosomal protein S18 acetylase RimI-like enzyme
MEFKKINPGEYGELLYKLDIQAFTRDFDYPSTSIQLTLKYLENCDVYLAYRNDNLIGVLAFEKKGGELEVKQIIVLPKYQGHGYGTIIVKKLLDLSKGYKTWLVTHPKNTRAIILYLKNGFQITAWKANYYGDREPRIVLQLSN